MVVSGRDICDTLTRRDQGTGLNADSISTLVKVPMTEMIALVHFLTQQEKQIVALNEYMDSALQKNYKIAFKTFTNELSSKVIQDIETESFCDAILSQFKKIIQKNGLSDEDSRQRIKKYSEDDISFISNYKRRCIGEGKSREILYFGDVSFFEFFWE